MKPLTLSDRILIVQSDLGFDQVQLGAAMGVTKGTVNQWLNGKIKSLKLEYAKRLQERYGYNVDWLVLGTGPKKGGVSQEGDVNSLKREEKQPLSDEAELLISCVRRLDGLNKHAPEIFGYIVAILELAHKGALTYSSRAGQESLSDEEESVRAVGYRDTSPNTKNATRKHAAKQSA